MRAKRYILLLVISTVLISATWTIVRAVAPTSEQPTQTKLLFSERDILRGLQGVMVLVIPLKPDVEQLGLTREALQIQTELQLRQYGIKVLSEEEWRKMPGMPALIINCDTMFIEETPLVAFSVQTRLFETVTLLRDPTIKGQTPTWTRSHLGTVGRNKLQGVRDWLKDHVAEFINDYLAANPKQAPTKKP